MKTNLKKLNILFLFLGLLVFAPKSVSAVKLNFYNGTSQGGTSISKGSCSDALSYGPFCLSNGDGKRIDGIRISMKYYDGKQYIDNGDSVDIFSEQYDFSNTYYAGKTKTDIKGTADLTLDDYTKYDGKVAQWDEKFYMDNLMEKYGGVKGYGDDDEDGISDYWYKRLMAECVDANGKVIKGSVLDELSSYMTDGQARLSEPSQYWEKYSEMADPSGNGLDKVGNRILIEDIRVYYDKYGKKYVMSPTEFAATALNMPGRFTPQQIQKYLSEATRLYSNFDDVGILEAIKRCTQPSQGNPCNPEDVVGKMNGIGVNIIDINPIIEKIILELHPNNRDCDWEGLAQKSFGDPLTPEEQACCEEAKEKIDINIDDFENACFITNDTVKGAIECFQEYFLNWENINAATKEQQEELKKLAEKYPACGCDFDEADTIHETFVDCFKSDIYNELQSLIKTGKNGAPHSKCYDAYTQSVTEYFAYNSPEVCGTLLDDCPLEDCPWLDPDPPGDDDDDDDDDDPPLDACDENDEKSFPVPGTDHANDRYCCDEVFEPGLKAKYAAEAESNGLTGEELDNYVAQQLDAWFNAADFRKYCLTGCDYDAESAAGGEFKSECCEQYMAEHPEMSEGFWISKGCKEAAEDKCSWVTYTTPLTDDLIHMHDKECEAGHDNTVTVSDTFDKECIFKSEELDPSTLVGEVFRDYYLKFSNPYCAVYCREDVSYTFPRGEMEVKAGHHFTVGIDSGHEPEWSPIHFNSTRECETFGPTSMDKEDPDAKKIQTEKFEEDWVNQNMKVIYAYDSLMQARNELYSANQATVDGECPAKCLEYAPPSEEEVLPECIKWSNPGQKWKGAKTYHTHWSSASETNPSAGDRREHTVEYCAYEDIPGETKADWIKSYVQEVQTQRDLFECEKHHLQNMEDDIHGCTNFPSLKGYSIPQEDREYDEPECQAFVSNTNLKANRYSQYIDHGDFAEYSEFEPTVSIDYEEPTYPNYNYSGELEKEIEEAYSGNFSTDGKEFKIKYECSGPGEPDSMHCYKKRVFKYSPQEKTEAVYTKDIEYRMDKNVFNTILKPQGIAVNGNSFEAFRGQIQLKLGYGALHIHFMTPSGIYGTYDNDDGKLDLTFPQFTASDSLGRIHNFDREEFGSTGKFDYDCNYKVVNEIIENGDPDCVGDNCEECEGGNCDPDTLKGLNLIFRPISLVDPFPGALGDGRGAGSNWSEEGDIENYITNNRGVRDSKVYYDKAPMYQITLIPALIQQVRRYNDTTTYNDFNMDCLSNGRECKSQFLRGQVGEFDFSRQLETCEISGNKGSEPCCGIGNWNDCDEKDGITRKE